MYSCPGAPAVIWCSPSEVHTFAASGNVTMFHGHDPDKKNVLAESAQTDKRIHELERSVQRAMGLSEDHRVHFTDLHDALTSMRFHGKPLPQVAA